MHRLILAVFSGALTVMVPAVAAQELESLQVYAGFVSETPGDFDGLGLPELALSPDFEDDTTSYAVTLPFSAAGISLVAAPPFGGKIIGAEGKTADGTELDFSSWTSSDNIGRTADLISFDSVPAGETTIRVAVESFGDRGLYSVVVNRATEVAASASLTRLELAAAERRSAAFELTPEFDTATTHYAVEVPGGAADLRLVTAAEHAGSVVDVRGVAADGQPLALDGSRVSGLVPGTNTLEITVTAEDETTTTGYTVAVTRAPPAAAAADARREVAEERRKAADARREAAEDRRKAADVRREAAEERRKAAEERRKARDARRADSDERSGTATDATREISNEDAGGTCVVGLELSPGQSCTHSAAGTFTVLEGGCANVSSIPVGRLCGADINANGLRATPVNDVNFRINALP